METPARTYEDGLRKAVEIARDMRHDWQSRANQLGKDDAQKSARDHYYGRAMGAGRIETLIESELEQS